MSGGRTSEVLRDTFGREHDYLRVSLTEKCSLRCLYCMGEDGVPPEELTPNSELLTDDEIVHLVSLFAAEGVSKVRLTGGEPLIRRSVVELVGRIADVPGINKVAMTTNGLVLPRKLPALMDAGLSAVNISLDTLDPAKFTAMTRRNGFERVLEAIELAAAAGMDVMPKVNAVIMRGVNDNEILDFVELTRNLPVQVVAIEWMPFLDNGFDASKMVPYQDLLATITDAYPDLTRCVDEPNATAKTWSVPGFAGSIGFITSMTNHFCGSCNRVRLLADGALKVCLFGNAEVSLRDAIRSGVSDDDLRALIQAAVMRKKASHGGLGKILGGENRSMVRIGG